ncbi:CPBP family intramembrane glutamic endopeptidase [Xanthomonas sp. XNM01]|uniref:CPBP family intramembrane glutamic endopeptidase n=1 Tax=Xanthomonas sp. XNM01 TaxID=2769289 RepID=UPI001781F441|nr:CPBP family intramembrane glutamic endopeptidase [Xanthomonas sp. XNM01]MBD9369175.1 CPBP family intramembrane metalloprotease [Xanthomonas sp. XNM01]
MRGTQLIWRSLVALAAAWALWMLALPLAGPGHGLGGRLLSGGVLAAGALALVAGLLHRDRIPWSRIGMAGAAASARAFALGLCLWLLPAAAGMALCLGLGIAQIAPLAPFAEIWPRLALLMLAVFLTEALPEEVIWRGYLQGLFGSRMPQWAALLLQALAFVGFAYEIGALHDARQWMFLPGFALILGGLRAMSGTPWTAIGFHTAMMAATQLLTGQQTPFAVQGMQTLQFLAFILLPSASAGVVLGLLHPHFRWGALGPAWTARTTPSTER